MAKKKSEKKGIVELTDHKTFEYDVELDSKSIEMLGKLKEDDPIQIRIKKK